jgi:hypothetical protein
MNPDLHMGSDLKANGSGNLFVIFGEPDIQIEDAGDGMIRVKVFGVDVFKPQTGEVVSEGTDGIALWMLDTDFNEESFFDCDQVLVDDLRLYNIPRDHDSSLFAMRSGRRSPGRL